MVVENDDIFGDNYLEYCASQLASPSTDQERHAYTRSTRLGFLAKDDQIPADADPPKTTISLAVNTSSLRSYTGTKPDPLLFTRVDCTSSHDLRDSLCPISRKFITRKESQSPFSPAAKTIAENSKQWRSEYAENLPYRDPKLRVPQERPQKPRHTDQAYSSALQKVDDDD